MKKILLTNDDGYDSKGILALRNTLQNLGEVILIAPRYDQSAVSHSLTMNRPLRVTDIDVDIKTVDGTPADCVAIAIEKLLDKHPDLLVSGINSGSNLGDDISYSGTVSAAVEGTMRSIPSIAFSLEASAGSSFAKAAETALEIARLTLTKGLPENTLLNVNFPATTSPKGIRITRQGRKVWHHGIQETLDPWGQTLYWIGGGTASTDSATDTDVYAVANGYTSITPIHFDKTNHEGIFQMREDWLVEDIMRDNKE